MNFFYYCPAVKKPSGGVKVIYQHVQALNEIGVNVWVLHPRSNFKCTWFEHNTPVWNNHLITTHDHLVVPEVDVLNLAGQLIRSTINFSIFVQGGGMSRGNSPDAINMVNSVYDKAQFILSISDDISGLIATYFPNNANKIIRVQPVIPSNQFSTGVWQEKENVISYMPRKNAAHADKIVSALQSRLPSHWRIQPIHNASESSVAALLKKSKIFLTFSAQEGFGMPPLEAALSGNYVIGYHGNGGREYWTNPVFEAIYPYDIKSFVGAVMSRVASLEKNDAAYCGEEELFLEIINGLSERYSINKLKIQLDKFAKLANLHSLSEQSKIEHLTLQHSPLAAWLIRKYRKFNLEN